MRLSAVAALLVAACGGSNPAPPQTASFQLTSAGVTPVTFTIASGGTVTFVNKDSAPHQITSQCAELKSPSLAANASFSSAAIAGPATCSFSDALNPSNSAFDGTVVVDAPAPGY
jgi:plastocyanin